MTDLEPGSWDIWFGQMFFGPTSGGGTGPFYIDAIQVFQTNYPTLLPPPGPAMVTVTSTGIQGAGTTGYVTYTPSTPAVSMQGAYTILEPVSVPLGESAELLASDNTFGGTETLKWDISAALGLDSAAPVVHLTASAVALDYANGATQDLSALGLR